MRHVVITGSSSGIGPGMAREFLKHGNTLTLHGRNERYQYSRVNPEPRVRNAAYSAAEPRGINTFRSLYSLGNGTNKLSRSTHSFENKDKLEESLKILQTEFPADITVNNAGLDQQRKALYDLELSEFERIINLNLTAMMKASMLKIFLRFFMALFHKRNIIKVLEAKTGNEQ